MVIFPALDKLMELTGTNYSDIHKISWLLLIIFSTTFYIFYFKSRVNTAANNIIILSCRRAPFQCSEMEYRLKNAYAVYPLFPTKMFLQEQFQSYLGSYNLLTLSTISHCRKDYLQQHSFRCSLRQLRISMEQLLIQPYLQKC